MSPWDDIYQYSTFVYKKGRLAWDLRIQETVSGELQCLKPINLTWGEQGSPYVGEIYEYADVLKDMIPGINTQYPGYMVSMARLSKGTHWTGAIRTPFSWVYLPDLDDPTTATFAGESEIPGFFTDVYKSFDRLTRKSFALDKVLSIKYPILVEYSWELDFPLVQRLGDYPGAHRI